MFKLAKFVALQGAKLPSARASFAKRNLAQSATQSLVHLEQRTLLRLAGEDVSDFLQGLITNDIRHLTEGAASIYSVFLNIKGRVLYDTIIYKSLEENTYFVECDLTAVDNLMKHLKIYKLRRKVDIQTMSDSMKVWSVFESKLGSEENCDKQTIKGQLEGRIFPCGSSDNKSSKLIDDISIYTDPRIVELGLRILTKDNVTNKEISQHLEPNLIKQEDPSSYRAFRYKLGIGEGTQDLPPGTSFPLEINCDYLHGVSFHKGCYIGQELTARTHHTGVVRKRLMPLVLSDPCSKKPLEFDQKIMNESGKVVGKVRGHEGAFGLGLIRISDALASQTLTVGDCVLKVVKPLWWPQESQKIEASLKSSKN